MEDLEELAGLYLTQQFELPEDLAADPRFQEALDREQEAIAPSQAAAGVLSPIGPASGRGTNRDDKGQEEDQEENMQVAADMSFMSDQGGVQQPMDPGDGIAGKHQGSQARIPQLDGPVPIPKRGASTKGKRGFKRPRPAATASSGAASEREQDLEAGDTEDPASSSGVAASATAAPSSSRKPVEVAHSQEPGGVKGSESRSREARRSRRKRRASAAALQKRGALVLESDQGKVDTGADAGTHSHLINVSRGVADKPASSVSFDRSVDNNHQPEQKRRRKERTPSLKVQSQAGGTSRLRRSRSKKGASSQSAPVDSPRIPPQHTAAEHAGFAAGEPLIAPALSRTASDASLLDDSALGPA